MVRENCFAYRVVEKEKEGIKWKESKCDCLTDLICIDKKCPFFRNADELEMYTFKIHQTPGVGYKVK